MTIYLILAIVLVVFLVIMKFIKDIIVSRNLQLNIIHSCEDRKNILPKGKSLEDITADKVKVFISHRMTHATEEEVERIRFNATNEVYDILEDEFDIPQDMVEIIDNYNHEDAPEDATNLWHLGRSIQQLGDADFIYFAEQDMFSRGCNVEYMIAHLYDIGILN